MKAQRLLTRLAMCWPDATRRGLECIAVLLILAAPSSALVQTERPASILFFPRIEVDVGRDTIVQITNTSNNARFARCFYITTTGSCTSSASACTSDADCPVGNVCRFEQSVTEFGLGFITQQPTFWVVSQGRSPDNVSSGLTSLIPAITAPFRGALECVEVGSLDFTGPAPVPGNALLGSATIVETSGAEVVRYHAIGLRG